MKVACVMLAALAVGASAAPAVAPARHNGGGGGRWKPKPVTCTDQNCLVAPAGTCGDNDCIQCFPTWATDADLKDCNKPCTDTNCLRCNMTNADQCLECANDGTDPFYVNSAGACVECTAENCASRGWERRGMVSGGCAADGSCKRCATGFGRDADGKTCVPCETNCALCSQDNVKLCYRCKPGYFWDGTACSACSPARVDFEGCASCPAQGVCRDCLAGYGKQWNRATRTLTCTPCPDGCARCEPDGQTCNACKPKEAANGQTTFWVYDQVSRTCYGPFVDSA